MSFNGRATNAVKLSLILPAVWQRRRLLLPMLLTLARTTPSSSRPCTAASNAKSRSIVAVGGGGAGLNSRRFESAASFVSPSPASRTCGREGRGVDIGARAAFVSTAPRVSRAVKRSTSLNPSVNFRTFRFLSLAAGSSSDDAGYDDADNNGDAAYSADPDTGVRDSGGISENKSNANEFGFEIIRGDGEGNDQISNPLWDELEEAAPSRMQVLTQLLGINIFTYVLGALIIFFVGMNVILGPGWLGQTMGIEGTGTFTEVSDSLPSSVDLGRPENLL